MDRNELIEKLCDYFELEYPEKENGEYVTYNVYDWEAGAYNGNGHWFSLNEVVNALAE